MIRNESDLILPFLRQCAELFDEVFVADIQSTDGTNAALRSFADPRLQVRVYDVDRQEKYQSALMNTLSREAFSRGADWVFLLDADEFLDVANRSELECYLREVGSDVLMAPWINLVPSHYGSYRSFEITQNFYWSGRTSLYTKVAISSLFVANNPDYFIAEGNHAVAPTPAGNWITGRPGLPILHVPIRSLDRFKLKIGSARQLTRAKHNRGQDEGVHVDVIDDLLSVGGVALPELNFIAANYGELIQDKRTLDPVELGWPVRRLPAWLCEPSERPPVCQARFTDLSESLLADAATVWDQTEFIKGTAVGAVIDGERIRIVPQPLTGTGRFGPSRFAALGPAKVTERPSEELLIDVVSISTMRVKAYAHSAWADLIPVMYALFVVCQPRRFVELGVFNGMSFFAGCQVSDRLNLGTECVAIDTWAGDEHSGFFHGNDVFENFRAHLKANHPGQFYIQALFAAALNCFDNGSIDLLHIDGLHTYQAVKQDFEAWLPKMSDTGVIIFHDINVFERDFGVWRLWAELRATYPSFGFAHEHGLGIIYVGREPHPVAAILRLLAENRHYTTLAQAYFDGIGTLLIEHRKNLAALDNAVAQKPLAEHRKAELPHDVAGLQVRLSELKHDYDLIANSTSWRIVAPVRKLLNAQPALHRFARRALKAGWWTATGQLPRRLRERRNAIQSTIPGQHTSVAPTQT